MADIFPTELLQSLLDDGRGPDVAPELRSAANVAEAMRRTGAHEVTCVIHADTHSGNSYLDEDGRACWLDWQIVQRGNWATDISYHLATVLDIEDRRAHEAELLRHYLGELEALGAPRAAVGRSVGAVPLSFSYGYFLWVITRISSRAVVLIHIPRLAAALDRPRHLPSPRRGVEPRVGIKRGAAVRAVDGRRRRGAGAPRPSPASRTPARRATRRAGAAACRASCWRASGSSAVTRTNAGTHFGPRSGCCARKRRRRPRRTRALPELEGDHDPVADGIVRHRVHRHRAHVGMAGDDRLDRRGGEVLAVDAQPLVGRGRRSRASRRRLGTRGRPTSTSRRGSADCVASSFL